MKNDSGLRLIRVCTNDSLKESSLNQDFERLRSSTLLIISFDIQIQFPDLELVIKKN